MKTRIIIGFIVVLIINTSVVAEKPYVIIPGQNKGLVKSNQISPGLVVGDTWYDMQQYNSMGRMNAVGIDVNDLEAGIRFIWNEGNGPENYSFTDANSYHFHSEQFVDDLGILPYKGGFENTESYRYGSIHSEHDVTNFIIEFRENPIPSGFSSECVLFTPISLYS